MRTDIALTCESCRHFRARTPKDRKHEAGYDHARHWCAKNDFPTLPKALRCGGDDYETRDSDAYRAQLKALGNQLCEFCGCFRSQCPNIPHCLFSQVA